MLFDRERLLATLATLDKLDAGWCPDGKELETAPYVEKWTILRSRDDQPFQLDGLIWSLPLKCQVFNSSLFAFDEKANWALLSGGWIVAGERLPTRVHFERDEVERIGRAWALKLLREHSSAVH